MVVPHFKLPERQQYDRISLEDAIRLYENRLLTAAGFIYTITKIYSANGRKLNLRNHANFTSILTYQNQLSTEPLLG